MSLSNQAILKSNFLQGSFLRDERRSILLQAEKFSGLRLTSTCSVESSSVVSGDSRDRRGFLLISGITCLSVACDSSEANARERRKPANIPPEDYKTASNGLKYFDFLKGNGEESRVGDLVSVHFDCIYKSLTISSSRQSKLLGGNRIIAQPYEIVVGSKPGLERKRDYVDSANGLFSAQAAPKPPKALYSIVDGMRVGGKRTVIVTPDEGYGNGGYGEMPGGETFEMNIELLEIKK